MACNCESHQIEIRSPRAALVDRAPGKRFVVLSGEERIIYDQDISAVEDEDARHRRKGARDEARDE